MSFEVGTLRTGRRFPNKISSGFSGGCIKLPFSPVLIPENGYWQEWRAVVLISTGCTLFQRDTEKRLSLSFSGKGTQCGGQD